MKTWIPAFALGGLTFAVAHALSPWWWWLRATLLGLFVGQMAGLAHDYTHVPRSAVGDAVTSIGWGVSHRWFRRNHLAHHQLLNAPLADPQFDYTPLFVQSEKAERCRPCPWRQRCFFPLVILLGRTNIQLVSLADAVRNGHALEAAGIVANVGWTTAALGGCWRSVLLLHAVVGAVVHVPFLLNHYTFEQYAEAEQKKMGWFERQIRTTVNYEAPPWLAWTLCGLDLHIEHHAFPTTPRHLLHTRTAAVKRECDRLGLPYRTISLLGAVRRCYARMTSSTTTCG